MAADFSLLITNPALLPPLLSLRAKLDRSCEGRILPEAIAEARRLRSIANNDGLLLIKGITNPDLIRVDRR